MYPPIKEVLTYYDGSLGQFFCHEATECFLPYEALMFGMERQRKKCKIEKDPQYSDIMR